MKKFLAALLIFSLPLGIAAESAVYVAKQEGKTLYLDITQFKGNLGEGAVLKLVTGAEELKNHKGVSLGFIYKYGPVAKVTQVQPKYAVAELAEPFKTTPGQELILQQNSAAAPAPAITAPLGAEAAPAAEPLSEQAELLFKSAPVREKLQAASLIKIDGKDYVVALAEKNKVKLFSLTGQTLTEEREYSFPGGKELITLSAADIKGLGSAQIFVIVSEQSSDKVYTAVLEYDGAALKQTGTLKWAARVTAAPGGARLLGQEIYKHNDIRLTPVGIIEYNAKKGKFVFAKLGAKSNSNATGFSYNYYDFDGDGKKDALFATSYGKLKVLFGTGKSLELGEGDYGTTPKRIAFSGKVLRALLPLEYLGEYEAHPVFAAAQNTSKLGIVTDTFGLYKDGQIDFIYWDGLSLKTLTTVKTGGVVYDLSLAVYGGQRGVLSTQVYGSGNTVLEIYKLK